MAMPITKRVQVITELNRIKGERQLSQQQLADEIGVSQPAISAWLNGADLPSTESLRKIRQAFPGLTALIAEAALETVLSESGEPSVPRCEDEGASERVA